ncbi:MAG: glycosyltransferase [Gemmatimonas sp.]
MATFAARHVGIRFSIVVPTFRRNHSLRECLGALARLDYARTAFEVIVVDDGSLDPPTDEVRGFEDLLIVRLVVVTPNAGPAKARNAGAAQASGEYLVLMDDDCVPDPDWLRRFDDRLRDFPRALVGGSLRNGAPESICAEASQQLVDYLYRYYNSDHDNARWFMSANIACPRAEFLSIGGFGTDFPLAAAEDRDFCDRWREAGYRLIMAPRATVSHVRPMSLAKFWQQHRTYGRGAHHLHQARSRRRVRLPSMEPFAFYLGLMWSPFTDGKGWRSPFLMVLLVLSQLGYALGYYPERRRAPLRTEKSRTEEFATSDSPTI